MSTQKQQLGSSSNSSRGMMSSRDATPGGHFLHARRTTSEGDSIYGYDVDHNTPSEEDEFPDELQLDLDDYMSKGRHSNKPLLDQDDDLTDTSSLGDYDEAGSNDGRGKSATNDQELSPRRPPKSPKPKDIIRITRRLQEYETRIYRLQHDIDRSRREIYQHLAKLDDLDQQAQEFQKQIQDQFPQTQEDIEEIFKGSNQTLEEARAGFNSHRIKFIQINYIVRATEGELQNINNLIYNAYESLAFRKMFSQFFAVFGSLAVLLYLIVMVVIFWRS